MSVRLLSDAQDPSCASLKALVKQYGSVLCELTLDPRERLRIEPRWLGFDFNEFLKATAMPFEALRRLDPVAKTGGNDGKKEY